MLPHTGKQVQNYHIKNLEMKIQKLVDTHTLSLPPTNPPTEELPSSQLHPDEKNLTEGTKTDIGISVAR